MSLRSFIVRSGLALGVAGATALALGGHVRDRLPTEGCVAAGTQIEAVAVTGCASPTDLSRQRAAAVLAQPIEIEHEGEIVVTGTVADLGGAVDEAALAERLGAVARTGSLWERLDEAEESRAGRVVIALPLRLEADILAARLMPFKADFDDKPVAARWDFASGQPGDHTEGRLVDVHATVEAVLLAARAGQGRVPLVIERQSPRATREVVATIDRAAIISHYETRYGFVGSQVGRAQNIARAAAGLDGLVMMPGEVVSFNELVGPRSLKNGFAEAGEIYKGEMVMGIGGGTCQVASTFHAAAYLGALEVVERSPHSRPSGYIGVGLDATVAYPHVDLEMRNPFDFPILVHVTAEAGRLRVELLGREQPARVELHTATVGISSYKRKVREAHWLEEGKIIKKQGGRRGVTIEKVRTMRFADGRVEVETTRDVYPPTVEIFYVPTGTDIAAALPPMPDGVEEG